MTCQKWLTQSAVADDICYSRIMDTGTVQYLTLTVRLIRSFEYRNIRFVVLKEVNPNCTVQQLMDQIDRDIKTRPNLPLPFKTHSYDCMKINSFAHGAKSNDTAITLSHDDEWILDPKKTLLESKIKNETELSYYNTIDYEKYKQNPRLLW